MSLPPKEKALALFARINEEISRTDEGKPGIRLEALRQMVRDGSEVVALVVQAYVKAGGNRNLQIAVGLAAAYEVELADDSLTLFVEHALADAGTPEALPKFVPEPGGENAVFQLTVERIFLDQHDTSPLLRALAIDFSKPASWGRVRSLQGRCVLAFPFDDDPREVWEIPEVRRYIASLLEPMPYLPYYLCPTPELGMATVIFSCLVAPLPVEDLTAEGLFAGQELLLAKLRFASEEVLATMLQYMVAVRDVAGHLGDDGLEICRSFLSGCPDRELAEWLLDALRER